MLKWTLRSFSASPSTAIQSPTVSRVRQDARRRRTLSLIGCGLRGKQVRPIFASCGASAELFAPNIVYVCRERPSDMQGHPRCLMTFK